MIDLQYLRNKLKVLKMIPQPKEARDLELIIVELEASRKHREWCSQPCDDISIIIANNDYDKTMTKLIAEDLPESI
jgi:hypothetical protein